MTPTLQALADGLPGAAVTPYSVTVRQKPAGGWLAVAKGHDRNGKPVILFSLAVTPDDALAVMVRAWDKPDVWKPDRLPPEGKQAGAY